jgi:selenocysteine-specific elongation factor
MIIGTAGHIDHGKTSLIAALTGKNTDRLPEEKRRGISIELGYAYHAIGDTTLGFIDVPGHEKFVHAMVSGASGIDYALLVIAADDGPMPQTREHLDILRMLGVHDGAVVLTKIDTVEPPTGDAAVAAIADLLADQPAAKWPLFPVSSITGDGIEALRDHLATQAAMRQAKGVAGHFRLAVDRSFSLPGIGTVVTGTAHAGAVAVGDDIQIAAPGLTHGTTLAARVRSLHAQDRPAERGIAGQRLALNLVGVSVDDVPRGSWINGTDLSNSSSRFDVVLEVSTAHDRVIGQGLDVHFHQGSFHGVAKIYPLDTERVGPGSACLASVVLPQSIGVCVGDRLIFRDSQAQTTLAGGRVLDITPPSRGKRSAARLAMLSAVEHAFENPSFASALSDLVSHGPMSIARVASGWNLPKADVMALATAQQLPIAGGVIFHPVQWAAFLEKALVAIDETHLREPEMPGMELNRCRRVATPQLDVDAFSELIDALVGQGAVIRKGAFLARPTHKAELSSAEKNLWQSIAPLLNESPYNPPRVRDIANLVHIPETEIRANLRRVARIGEVTLIALDHFFLTDRVAEMAQFAQELFDQKGVIRAADFRDRIGGGRKVAIQILEFFDRIGYTRRLRDDHLIRRPNPFVVN